VPFKLSILPHAPQPGFHFDGNFITNCASVFSAFVTFTDSRDAEDAVRYRDGITFGGNRLRVEVRRNNHRADRSRDYGRYDGDDRRRWEDRERRSKRRRDGSYGGGYGGGGGYADRKRDDSDGSHDDTVGHYKGQKGDFIVDNKRGTSYEV